MVGSLLVDRPPAHLRGETWRASSDVPRNWFDVLNLVALDLTGSPPARWHWRDLVFRRGIMMTTHPNIWPLLAPMFGVPVVYLCWGLPGPSKTKLGAWIKRWRLRRILRSARLILVNDPITARDVELLVRRSLSIVPYVIDAAFFRFGPPTARAEFVLVPGNIDRDEALVAEFASRGVDVVRVTLSGAAARYHREGGHRGKVTVYEGLSFAQLRDLYLRAKVVALPLTSNHHAAGQTSVLEALACGAPVVISRGRTAALVEHFETVVTCASHDVAEWLAAIDRAGRLVDERSAVLARVSEEVSRTHAPDVVATTISRAIRNGISVEAS